MPINGCFTPLEMERITNAIEFVNKNYREPISADQLAIDALMDTKKLQLGFQLSTGLTIHSYLLKVRVSHTIDDLANFERSIKEIAYKNGFCSSSHFCSEFKRQTGFTPKAYRDSLLANVFTTAVAS